MRRIFNLKKLREEHALSQTELAMVLGVTQTDISRYEAHTDAIPFKALLALSQTFGLRTFDDFFNEQQSVSPLVMEDAFSLLRRNRQNYLDVLFVKNVDFETYLQLFFLERPLYQHIHKPLIVVCGANVMQKQDFVTSLAGIDIPVPQVPYPVFIAANAERMPLSEDPKIHEVFPWQKEPVWYFRQTKMTPLFDINLSQCVAYACAMPVGTNEQTWDNEYADFFLNVASAKDARTAVIYADTSVLANCNIVFDNSFKGDFEPELKKMAAIIIEIDDAASQDNALSISVGLADSHERQTLPYHFVDETVNHQLHEVLAAHIRTCITAVQENYRTRLDGYFALLEKTYEKDPLNKTYSDEALLAIWTEFEKFKSEIKILLNESVKNSIDAFDAMYTRFVDAHIIEKTLLSLGKTEYAADDEKKRSFPCNSDDLEKAKETLYQHFKESFYDILEKDTHQFILAVIEKGTVPDSPLSDFLALFMRGLQLGITSDESEHLHEGHEILMETFRAQFSNLKSALASYPDEACDTKVIFYKALESIVTFARGLSLSKAKKIATALQNYQIHKAFVQVITKTWEYVDTVFTAMLSSQIFNDSISELPKNAAELKEAQGASKKVVATIKRLRAVGNPTLLSGNA